MRSFALVCISLGAWLFSVPAWSGHTLTETQEKALQSWLARHPNYRAAIDADCHECSDEINETKAGTDGWEPVPDYRPYIATGDFNGDGTVDFAVVLIDRSKRDRNFSVAVFNGPYQGRVQSPAFLKSGFSLRHGGLFFGPPRPKPYRLVIGNFNAGGVVLMPHRNTYRLDDGD